MLEFTFILLLIGFVMGYFANHFMWTKWLGDKLEKLFKKYD